MADYFCHPHAPEDFKVLVQEVASLQKWVKPPRTDAELSAALDWIYIQHTHHRNIIQNEIENRRHIEIDKRLSELKDPHWSVTPTFWIALAGLLIGLFAWLFPRSPSAVKEELKSAVLPTLSAPTQPPPDRGEPLPVVAPPSSKVDAVVIPATQPAP